jgi:hypothetical protein
MAGGGAEEKCFSLVKILLTLPLQSQISFTQPQISIKK